MGGLPRVPRHCTSPSSRAAEWGSVILLIQDLDVRIVNAVTGELLRELTINTDKDYQPRKLKWVRLRPAALQARSIQVIVRESIVQVLPSVAAARRAVPSGAIGTSREYPVGRHMKEPPVASTSEGMHARFSCPCPA